MKKIILSLLLVLSGISVAQQQPTPSETGNIVYTTLNPPPPGAPFTWNGFVNYNTGGGGLDGGAIPAYNSNTGTFIFGFMPGTVNYSLAVNFALANAGTGIQVNGFKYSWQYYNQDYSRGPLSANISFTNNKGSVIESYFFGMPQTTEGWTLMSGSKNFNTPYAPASLGNLNLSISGKDDRFWAGYWGPQIKDIDVRLLYGPVPQTSTSCTAYSIDPTCIAQNSVASVTNTTPTTYTAPITTVTEVVNTSATPTTTVAATSLSPTTTNSTASQTTTTTITSTASTPTVNAIPTATTSGGSRTTDGTSIGLSLVARNQQREQAIAMQASQNAIAGAEQISQQVQQEALTVASQAVTNSFSAAQNSTKTTTTNALDIKTVTSNNDTLFQIGQTGTSVSLFSSPTIQTTKKQADDKQSNTNLNTGNNQQQITKTYQGNIQENVSTVISQSVSIINTANIASSEFEFKPPAPLIQSKAQDTASVPSISSVDTSVQQSPTYSLLPPVVQTNSQVSLPSFKLIQEKEVNFVDSLKFVESNVNPIVSSFNILPPKQEIFQPVSQPAITSSNQNSSNTLFNNQPNIVITNEYMAVDSQKMFLDRANPLFQTMENKLVENQNTNLLQQGPVVNRNAQNNEVAGGVDINKIAQAPAGYNEYLNFSLRDAVFYAPKEVYKNQRVIDNARALRQLSSDRLHQELVNQQYERK